MTSISPSLILTLCILAALVMTVLAFTVWRLMRARPDTDAEVSALTASANPFREPSREQAEYMRGQRRRYVGVMMGEEMGGGCRWRGQHRRGCRGREQGRWEGDERAGQDGHGECEGAAGEVDYFPFPKRRGCNLSVWFQGVGRKVLVV